jgi:exodeoxyribonuclease III
MKLLTWNIRHGGGKRLVGIADAIANHAPDIIALTEYRSVPGDILCGDLGARGWPHVVTTAPEGSENGICVLARTAMRGKHGQLVPPANAARWLDVEIPAYGLALAALHIPTASHVAGERAAKTKTQFWNAVLHAAKARAKTPFMLVGDFNTGAHRVDEVGKTFHCAAHFGNLCEIGWTDVWRHQHPSALEYSWYSKGKNGLLMNGFRIDHVFVTASLLPRIGECRYSHAEREAGISDHSIMMVEMAQPAAIC